MSWLVAFVAGIAAWGTWSIGGPGMAATPSPRPAAGSDCPYLAASAEVSLEIVRIAFTDVVVGTDSTRRLTPEAMEKYRFAVVTIRVNKPAGKALSVAAADLTLHYKHGGDQEVAPCEAISSFSSAEDVDRPVKFSKHPGPGWMKQPAGPRSREAEELYFDAVFSLIEPDIREAWLCVARPANPKPYVIQEGWKKGQAGKGQAGATPWTHPTGQPQPLAIPPVSRFTL
jgi:hypothetical protein